MKSVIITIPMKQPEEVTPLKYPMDGNKAMEYEGQVCCPISAILAKTLNKEDEVKIIYIITKGENSHWEKNKETFIKEIENINKDIGAVLSYDTVEIPFEATKQAYNKLITDLAAKIPENAELYVDYTYGSKPEILSLFCALRFAEEFREAIVQYIVYGKVEFKDKKPIPNTQMLYDTTSLYYLFKLMGTMGAATPEEAEQTLKDFFAM